MFSLPDLPYDFNALEPWIDEQTMRLHHDKHHQTYVDNLNKALENLPEFSNLSIEDLMFKINDLPEDVRLKVRNNGGGHFNHSLFWQNMAPPQKDFKFQISNFKFGPALEKAFGTFEKFQEQFSASALGRFGSGWVWLVSNNNQLLIMDTPNQDNPLMADPANKPILALDVWEHSYYLKYQNRRADYIKAWWNVVNWAKVATLV